MLIPSGQVLLFDNGAKIFQGALDANGLATAIKTITALGVHNMQIQYAGDANYNAGVLNFTHTVADPAKQDPVISVTETPDPSAPTEAVTFAISVQGS